MRFQRVQPLYVHIATLFFFLFLLLGGLQILLNYRQSYIESYTHSHELFSRQSTEIEQALQLQIRPVQLSLQLLTRTPAPHAGSLPERLQILPWFVEVLRGNPAVSAVYIGYRNGDFFLVRLLTPEARQALAEPAPDWARYLIQSIDSTRQGREGVFLFADSTLRVRETRPQAQYNFDPRKRIWYQEAEQSPGVIMSRPYLFFTTREPGSTLATATDSGNSVLGADISIAQLSLQLAALPRPSGGELVLYDDRGQMIATTRNLAALLRQGQTLPLLSSVAEPVFTALQQELPRHPRQPGTQQEFILPTATGTWMGHIIALPTGNHHPLYLALLLPDSTFAQAARTRALSAIGPALIALLFMFPGIWLVARHTAKPLLRLKEQVQAIRRFDFSGNERPHSRIQEIDDLAEALTRTKQTIREFMSIGKALSAEHHFDPLITTILQETLKAVGAHGGVMYLRVQTGKGNRMDAVRAFWQQEERPGLASFYAHQGHALASVAHGLRKVDGIDAATWQRDFSPLAPYDQQTLLIAEPLLNRSWEVIGILSVVLPSADQADLNARIALIEALAGTSAIAIETQHLIEEQKKLLDSFIELVAGAIDAKSPYTGGHCQRVPVLTKMLARAACSQHTGPFAEFLLDNEEWEALHIASWLHDCGKVTTPEFIVDKATKLETLYDRIHEIRMRFEVLKRDAHIALQDQQLDPAQKSAVHEALQPIWQQLDEEFAFVAACNQGGETMDNAQRERLQKIAGQQWTRTLDSRLGVSQEELQRQTQADTPPPPCLEPLLADRPEHLQERPQSEHLGSDNPWGFKINEPKYLYNRGELYNLSIPRGTLTEEERYKINQHISQTIIMLNKLPFPYRLRNVPEIAGGHHEKLDGTGYPKRLMSSEISLQARMITIADVFEALTARDRPYKKGKSVSEALGLMAGMVRVNHLDRDLFILLLESGIWQEYARTFLEPDQLDTVDTAALLATVQKPAVPKQPEAST